MVEVIIIGVICMMALAFYMFRAPRRILIERWLNERGMTLISIKRDYSNVQTNVNGGMDIGFDLNNNSNIELYDITAARRDETTTPFFGSARIHKVAGQYTITVMWEDQNPLLGQDGQSTAHLDVEVERRIEWLKQNPQALMQYDMDGNGHLDAEEWERIRFLLREEVKAGKPGPPVTPSTAPSDRPSAW